MYLLKKNHLLKLSVFLAIVFVLSACDSGTSGPSTDELEEAAKQFLPGHIELTSFKLEAEKNEGDEVTPIFVHRFVADVRAREAAYSVKTRLEGTDVLKEEMPKGYSATLYGVSQSNLKAGKWDIHVVYENAGVMKNGRTRAEFSPNALFEGSPEIAVLEAESKARSEERKNLAEQAAKKQKQDEEDAKARHNQRLVDIFNSGQSYEGSFEKKRNQIPFRIKFNGKNTKIKFLETNETFGIKDPEIFKSTSTLMFFIDGRPDIADWAKVHRWDLTLDESSGGFAGVYDVQKGRYKYKLSVKL